MRIKGTAVFSLLLAAGLVALMLPARRLAAGIYTETVEEDDRYYLPPASWLRFFSLGYNEAMADIVWVKTIVYFGEQMTAKQTKTSGQFVMNYLLNAAALDPRFRTLYTVGSTFTLFQQRGQVTPKSIKMAIALLEKGTEAYPNDGEIFFSLGFIHYYEIIGVISEDPDDPALQRHRKLGRYYFSRAAMMDNAPPYAALLSATLMEKSGGMDEMVTAHLKAMLLRETDPTIRARLIEKLRKQAGKTAERDIAETERLQEEWRRDFGFVPYDFYLFLRTETPLAELIDPLYLTDRMLESGD